MATKHHPASAAGVSTSHAIQHVDSSVTLPVVTLPHAGVVSSPGPCQHPPLSLSSPAPASAPAPPSPFTKYDLNVVGNPFSQPRRHSSTEPNLTVVLCDSKGHHDGDNSLSPSLQDGLSATKDEHGSSLHVGVPGELTSFQSYDQPDDGNAATGGTTASTGLGPTRVYCATIASPASKRLHYHINPDGKMYRWGAEDGPIPIGINLESFKSSKHGNVHGNKCGLMVQNCLEAVVQKLNHINVGPQFEFVQTPSESAFFVTHGIGNADNYASAFFPGSDPKDWYVYVYDLGLELDELHLIKILTHEMMHVLGLRHCFVDPQTENEPYVRYPRGITDHENWDILMQPHLTLSDLSEHDLKLRTVEDLRAIYALETGEWINGCEIQDVSWKVGAAYRRAIAWNNACICIPKL